MNTTSIGDHQINSTMTLSGQGQVEATPDQAIVRLGVQTTGANLTDTQSENAGISQAILQALMSMGVTNIRTYQYLVDKNYTYDNGKQIDNGYTVRNIFEIKTEDTDKVGAIIDSAISSGANVVDFISFNVANEDFYYQQALNLAVEDALQKAKSIASFLGHKSYPVPFHIVENSSMQPFASQVNTFREGAFATPIEPGRYLINAAVTIDFYD